MPERVHTRGGGRERGSEVSRNRSGRRPCWSRGRGGRKSESQDGARRVHPRSEFGHVVRRGIARRVRKTQDDARGPLLCGRRRTGRLAVRIQEEVTTRPRGHRDQRPRLRLAVRGGHGSRQRESGRPSSERGGSSFGGSSGGREANGGSNGRQGQSSEEQRSRCASAASQPRASAAAICASRSIHFRTFRFGFGCAAAGVTHFASSATR